MTQELDKLDGLTERLMKVLERGVPVNSSSITITGSGALTIVGIFAITVAVSCVLIVAAWRQADLEKLQTMRTELNRVQQKMDEHDVWIKTMYVKQKQEK